MPGSLRYRVSDISYANRLCEADFICDLLLEKEENFMLTMKKADYEKILAHAKENLPEEACGLIAGTKDGDKRSSRRCTFWRMWITPMSIFP